MFKFKVLSVFIFSLYFVANAYADTGFVRKQGEPSHEIYFEQYIPTHNSSLNEEVTDEDKLKFIQDIRARNCEKIFLYLEQESPYFFINPSSLLGYFFEDGICTEVNYKIAADIYSNSLDEIFNPHFAAARLGNLYYLGLGVEKNLHKATLYFKKAAIIMAVHIWDEEADSPIFVFDNYIDSIAYKAWGVKEVQLAINFATIESGPWELPTPLKAEVVWIKSLWTNDGSQIINVAKQIHDGVNGFEKGILDPISWMSYLKTLNQNKQADAYYNIWNQEFFSDIEDN